MPKYHDGSVEKRRWVPSRACRGLLLQFLLGAVACQTSEPNGSGEVVRTASQPLILDDSQYVVTSGAPDRLVLAANGQVAPIALATEDYPGVIRVAGLLQADLGRVTGVTPSLLKGQLPTSGGCVVVGTLGKSPLIDQLVAAGKLDVSDIAGKWEASSIQVVDQPWAGVDRALVIAGSDKRGTIYGMFDLSEQIGVSPWYYWADVPIVARSELHVLPGKRLLGPPAVKYRGIFINDEAPALSGWVSAQFGGFNSKFYDKLFELILRLRGNYLWPAMWGKSFGVDDPLNPQLADEYGIVMGTSHHEPMMRNQAEWATYGSGAWNYATNQAALDTFWTDGIRRMGERESIVTIGMRGDGDAAMSPNPDTVLLQTIITNQRGILANVTGKDPSQIPQVWTLYKEVQDYYDLGLRAPDDVTTMLADDNFGNIRKLPVLGATIPSGGFGVYYHYDYVGGPRNYKWLNTNLIPRVWEQMHLAYDYGVNRIWIVNVGDLKLLEVPTQFFLDYAWSPARLGHERLTDYTTQFAARQFGAEKAAAIAQLLLKYSKYNARRKPELLVPETYSLVNYREAERVVTDYNRLADEADAVGLALPSAYRAAFDELVWFPIKASANLNDLYLTVAKNRLYAKQGRVQTNAFADRAQELFAKDAELTSYYNTKIAGGKWNHIADQTHIGYTSWQEPAQNTIPTLTRITVPAEAAMGVAVEGSEMAWPVQTSVLTLPEFNPYQLQPAEYVEIFNRGQTPFAYRVESAASYLTVSPTQGTVQTQQRIWVQVDWTRAPVGVTQVPLSIYGPNSTRIDVTAPVNRPALAPAADTKLIETNGYVAMDADQFSRKVELDPIRWQVITDLSRTGNGVTAFPVTAAVQIPGGSSPHLEYDVQLWKTGSVIVRVQVAPTQKFVTTGLKYAVSFDDQQPQTVNMHSDTSTAAWETSVRDNVNTIATTHSIATAGKHVLKFWVVNPGVVLQKIVVETGAVRPSYLGPPTATFEEPPIDVASAGAAGTAATGGAAGTAATGGTAGTTAIGGTAGLGGAGIAGAGLGGTVAADGGAADSSGAGGVPIASDESGGTTGTDESGGTSGISGKSSSATGGKKQGHAPIDLGGCGGCRASRGRSNSWLALVGFTLIGLRRTRRRTRPS